MDDIKTIKHVSNVAIATLTFLSCTLPSCASAERFALEVLNQIQDREEQAERVDRENWARIVTSGGKIFAVRDVYGCVSLQAYADIMSFILYGKGKMLSPDQCWKLENGLDVQLTNGEFPICDATQTICEFEAAGISSWISSPFYTTVFTVHGK